jgi:DNA-binding transcriptional LysR family regulator
MIRDELSLLSAFLLVAEQRSFTQAAKRLGVSPSALSHAIRGLEQRFGVRLLARTTRSVSPTDAGAQLLARLRPALGDIRGALDLLSGLADRPAGRVRLVISSLAAKTVLAPNLGRFARDYPDVVLEVTTTEARVDLVAAGFDAGIHLGEFIERDMATVRVSPDRRPAIVASPTYFASHPKPVTPRDLTSHRCINFRHGSEGVYRWELDKGKQSLRVAVEGPLIVDEVELVVRAAVDGVGLAFMAEESAAPHLASGALVRVLEDWCPPYPGFFLYYPRQGRLPAALAAVVETLKLEDT